MRPSLLALALCLVGCPPSLTADPSGGAGGSSEGGGGSGAGGSGGGSTSCSELDDDCNVGERVDGACVRVPRPGQPPCDDGLGCTVLDHCEAGLCVAGAPAECVSVDRCLVAECNEDTGQCELVPGNEGDWCDDGDACTSSSVCQGGACVGTSGLYCGEETVCARWECDPVAGCTQVPQNVGVVCSEPGPCIRFVCKEGGYCGSEADNFGGVCDDGQACTTNDTCVGEGYCLGEPVDYGTSCDDGDVCTTDDTCSSGECLGVVLRDCMPRQP